MAVVNSNPRKRLPSPKGRTDKGVAADETGAYATQTEGGSPCVVYRLRCLTDGMVRDFVDDGNSREGGPMNGRQNVVNVITKEIAAFIGDDEELFPAFFLDKKIGAQYMRVGKHRVPVADAATREQCKKLMEQRQRRREGRASAYEREKQRAIADRISAEDKAREHLKKGQGNA